MLAEFTFNLTDPKHRLAVMALVGLFAKFDEEPSPPCDSPAETCCEFPCAENGCEAAKPEAPEVVASSDLPTQDASVESATAPEPVAQEVVAEPEAVPAGTPEDDGLVLVPALTVETAIKATYKRITEAEGKPAGKKFGDWVSAQCQEFGKSRISDLDERSRSILYERLINEYDQPPF